MQYSIEVNNQVEIYDINKVAKQASGAALLRVKNTVVLATVAREDTQVSEDFLPLTVQYTKKTYMSDENNIFDLDLMSQSQNENIESRY